MSISYVCHETIKYKLVIYMEQKSLNQHKVLRKFSMFMLYFNLHFADEENKNGSSIPSREYGINVR